MSEAPETVGEISPPGLPELTQGQLYTIKEFLQRQIQRYIQIETTNNQQNADPTFTYFAKLLTQYGSIHISTAPAPKAALYHLAQYPPNNPKFDLVINPTYTDGFYWCYIIPYNDTVDSCTI